MEYVSTDITYVPTDITYVSTHILYHICQEEYVSTDITYVSREISAKRNIYQEEYVPTGTKIFLTE